MVRGLRALQYVMMTFREPESCFSREFTLIIRAIKRQFGCCSHQTIVYRQPTLQEKSIMEKFAYQICVAALSLFRLAQGIYTTIVLSICDDPSRD